MTPVPHWLLSTNFTTFDTSTKHRLCTKLYSVPWKDSTAQTNLSLCFLHKACLPVKKTNRLDVLSESPVKKNKAGEEQWFSARAMSPLRGHWQCLETFFVVAVGWVGAARGSCSTFYKAQDSPPPQAIVPPQMSLMPRLRIPGPEKREVCSSRWGQDRPLERDI